MSSWLWTSLYVSTSCDISPFPKKFECCWKRVTKASSVFPSCLFPSPEVTGVYWGCLLSVAWIQHKTSYKKGRFLLYGCIKCSYCNENCSFYSNWSPFSSSPEHVGSKSGRNLLLRHTFWSPRSGRQQCFSISAFLPFVLKYFRQAYYILSFCLKVRKINHKRSMRRIHFLCCKIFL